MVPCLPFSNQLHLPTPRVTLHLALTFFCIFHSFVRSWTGVKPPRSPLFLFFLLILCLFLLCILFSPFSFTDTGRAGAQRRRQEHQGLLLAAMLPLEPLGFWTSNAHYACAQKWTSRGSRHPPRTMFVLQRSTLPWELPKDGRPQFRNWCAQKSKSVDLRSVNLN